MNDLQDTVGRVGFKGLWKFECFDLEGNPKWEVEESNLVTIAGLNHILETEFRNNTVVSTWYVGLKAAGAANNNDTLASHGTWTEITAYTTGNRQTFTSNVAVAGSITNNNSKASFSINTNATVVAGGFLASVNNGTSGTLFAAVDFTGGNKTCDNGDTLQVTYTVSANTV
jgi:hypothetical protein